MDGWRIEAREQLRCSNSRSELPGDLPWNFTRGLWFRLPALRQALYDRQRLSAKSKVGTMLCGRVLCRKNSRPDLNFEESGVDRSIDRSIDHPSPDPSSTPR